MTQEESIFNDFTVNHGGLFTTQDIMVTHLRHYFSRSIEWNKEKCIVKRPPHIIFNFIDNVQFGAFADLKNKDYAIIGLYIGTKYLLTDIFNRMLSYNNLFLDIGDASKEILSEPSIRNFYTNTTDLFEFGNLKQNEYYDYFQPIDETRHFFASHLTKLSLTFIFEHEISHIINGHIHYIKTIFDKSFTDNYNAELPLKVPLRTYQALEMDADCSAVNSCTIIAINNSNPNNDYPDKAMKNLFTSREGALLDMFLAIYMTLRLMGDGRYRLEYVNHDVHAPNRVRQVQIMTTLIEYVDYLNKEHNLNISLPYLEAKMYERARECERAYEVITGNTINFDAFNKEYYAEHPLAGITLESWKKIRPDLMEFSFTNLAP